MQVQDESRHLVVMRRGQFCEYHLEKDCPGDFADGGCKIGLTC